MKRRSWQQQRKTILYSSYVLLYVSSQKSIFEFCLQSWRCSLKKKHSRIILTSHVSALFNTACGFVGLRSWAYVYICIHVIVIRKIICLWAGGGKVLFVGDFCQGNIQSSFQQSLSTVQMVQPFPPSGVQLWDYGENVWRKHCWNVFAFSSHLACLFSSPWQMQCVSVRLLFEIWISLMLEWWGHITHAVK